MPPHSFDGTTIKIGHTLRVIITTIYKKLRELYPFLIVKYINNEFLLLLRIAGEVRSRSCAILSHTEFKHGTQPIENQVSDSYIITLSTNELTIEIGSLYYAVLCAELVYPCLCFSAILTSPL